MPSMSTTAPSPPPRARPFLPYSPLRRSRISWEITEHVETELARGRRLHQIEEDAAVRGVEPGDLIALVGCEQPAAEGRAALETFPDTRGGSP